jgi:hypothetical protein
LDINLHFGISQEHCMKKFVFASVMTLASLSLVYTPKLQAQDSITIKDPAEYNAYQMASTQSDPKTRAAALQDFLDHYPQSVVKKAVLDMLMDTYLGLNDPDHALSAASRLLQLAPDNMKAIYTSVFIKKAQCGKTQDAQTCDDAAVLAQKGLATPKPAGTSDDDWKKLTGTYPMYHSAIALDDAISKKDFKAAEAEYTAELMLYSDVQAQTVGLADTLQLATAYSMPGAGQDLVKAVWFFARVWDFAPPAYQAQIEPKLEYYYKKYHGKLEGLDAIKAQAKATTFPPGTFVIPPAPTAAEQIHAMLTDPTTKLGSLALSDKETILALGSKDDAEQIWAVMKGQATPVPGIVLEATNSVIKVAVTQDAKDAKVPDFIVNLKTPLADKDVPAVGFEFKLQPAAELDGTYDTYTQIPATATMAQTAQIVLRDGVVVPEKKKVVPHKPAAGHRPASH